VRDYNPLTDPGNKRFQQVQSSIPSSTGYVPVGYIAGLGRDVPHPARSHLYKGTFTDPGLPMCRYGWNRDKGTSYSIWRGNVGRKGICRTCLKRALAGLPPVEVA